MKILAHRGASVEAPENTHAAIRRAWDAGADGLETDLRLTQDGEIVLMHDASASRTTGEKVDIASSTLARISALDAGEGERVPALREVLAEFPEEKELYLDIKSGAEIVAPLKHLLAARPFAPALLSFVGSDAETLARIKESFPTHRVYWNRSRRRNGGYSRWIHSVHRWITGAQEHGLDGLGLDVRVRIDESCTKALAAAGQGLFAWTVNDPAEADRLRVLGATALATDNPRDLSQKG